MDLLTESKDTMDALPREALPLNDDQSSSNDICLKMSHASFEEQNSSEIDADGNEKTDNSEMVTSFSSVNNDEKEKSGDDEKEPERRHREETSALKQRISQLSSDLQKLEKKHEDTVHTYRTHLISAVQGHMDQDVKEALYHIIELRSMEQFC